MFRQVAFQIGTDMIGQPMYCTHIIYEKQTHGNKVQVSTVSKTHR